VYVGGWGQEIIYKVGVFEAAMEFWICVSGDHPPM